jgi:hypothetical protein
VSFASTEERYLLKYLYMPLTLVALYCLFGSAQAHAQSNISLPTCHDINGRPVQQFETQNPEDGPAFSTAQNGAPIIVVNWTEMQKYASSTDTAKFILEHECGHCALGHIYEHASRKKTNQQELLADCYAAKQAKSLGININNVIKDVDLLPRDPDHPAGLVRAKNILNCYNQ